MGAKAKTQFTRRLNRWRLKRSPLKVAFLLFLWLVAIASEMRAGELKNNGTLKNTGTIRVKDLATGIPAINGGVYEYFGADQLVPSMTYQNLKLTGSGTKEFKPGTAGVLGTFTIASGVTGYTPAGSAVHLDQVGGTFNEQGYLLGSIDKQVTLAGAAGSSSFGTIGATISWTGTAPGATTVTRITGVASTSVDPLYVGKQSIKRYFDIAATFSSGLNGTLIYKYADIELNGQDENTLSLWRSVDGGQNWRKQGGVVDPALNTITKSGILSFSRWTASDAANPLGPSSMEYVAQNIVAFSGNGQSGSTNTTLGSPLIVTVTDGYGNLMANIPVTFAIASAPGGATGQNLSVTNTTTNASGQVSTVLQLGNTAGTYTVTATSGSLTGSPISFTATATGGVPPPPVATSMVLANGNTQVDTVGRQLANSFVVTVLDQFGAPYSGATINFAITGKPAGDSTSALSAASVTTNASGQASTRLTLGNKPGSYTIVATSSSLSGASINFSASAVLGRPSVLQTIAGNGQSQTVKKTLSQSLVVAVTDSLGNLIQGVDVQFAMTSTPLGATGQSVTPASVATDVLGRASAQVVLGDKIGVYQIAVTSAGLSGSPVTFNVNALAAAAARMLAVTGNGQSGMVTSQLANSFVVSVVDSQGGPISGSTVRFAIANAPSGAAGQLLTDSVVVTDATGRAISTLKLGTKAGVYTVTASSTGLAGSPQTFSATAQAGPAVFVNVASGNTISGQVGATLSQPFVVAVTDSFGNAVNGANVRYAITSSPSGAIGQGPRDTTVVADVQGQTSVRFTTGTKVGTYSMMVSVGSLTPQIITVNASAGPAAALAAATGSSQSGPVNSALPQPMTVTVVDAFGNPVSGTSVSFAVTGAPAGATGQLLSSLSVTTGADGQASTVLTLGGLAGSYTVSATSGSLAGSPIVFTASATVGAAVRMLALSGNGQVGVVATQLSNPFVVTVVDNQGNPVPGATVRFDVTNAPAGAAGQSLTETVVVTNAGGQAVAALKLGTKAGVYAVTATSTGLTGSPQTFSATAQAGAAALVSLPLGNSVSGQVGTTLNQPFVVSVTDAFGNAVSGASVRYAITSSPSGAIGQSPRDTTVISDAQGQTSVRFTTGTKAGTYTIMVIVGSTPQVVTINASAGPAVSLAAATGLSQSGTVSTTLPQPMSVTAVDAFGNPVSGAPVSFSISSAPSGAGGQQLSTASVVTGANGQASTQFTLGTKAGLYTVVAKSTALPGISVAFNATANGGRAALISMLSGNGQSQAVKTTLTLPFVALVTDSFGNPIEGENVLFAITKAPASATGQRLSDVQVSTDVEGRAQTVLTLGDSIGVYEASATSGALQGSPIKFTTLATSGVAQPAAASVKMATGNKQIGVVGSQVANPFVVTVFDQFGTPYPGATVNFAVASTPGSDPYASLTSTTVVTDASGRASTSLIVGRKAGTYVVVATSGNLPGSPVAFAASGEAGRAVYLSQVSGNNQSVLAKTLLPERFVVSVTDSFGNVKQGVNVQFSVSSVPTGATGQSLTVTQGATDSTGRASAHLTLGNKPGSYLVTAASSGLTGSPITFTSTASVGAAATLLAVSGNGQSGVVATQLSNPFVVTVMDASGNPVSGVDVRFALAGAPAAAVGQSLTDTLVVTNANGQAATRLKLGTTVGVYSVSASSVGLVGSPQTFNGTAKAGVAASVSLPSGNILNGQVGSTLSLPSVVVVTDAFGNAVSGENVRYTITSSPAGAIGQGPRDTTVVTDAQGQTSVRFTSGTKVGTYMVTVNVGSLTPQVITINATAGPAASLAVVSGNNQTAMGGSVLPEKFVVAVTDAFGNVKQGAIVQFAITSTPVGSTGAALTAIENVTDSIGHASVQLRLGDRAGTYQVRATSSGLAGSPVVFTASATIAGPVSIAYTAGDKQSAQVFTTLASPFVVTVLNAQGNPVPGVAVRFAIALAPVGATGAAMSDTLVLTDASGRASSTLTLGRKVGAYTVTATSGTLSGSPVIFTATGVAGKAVYLWLATGDNQTGLAANALSEPLTVSVTDSFGNAKQGVTVSYAITSSPDSAVGQVLTSTSVLTDADGLATVRLTLGSRIGLYKVSASAASLLGSPAIFNVTATTIVGSNQTGIVSNRLQQPFSTLVLDQFGKPVVGALVTFTIDSIPSGSSGASFNGSTTITVRTDSTGMASAFLTLGNQAGTYRVTASSPSLTGGVVIFRATAVSTVSQPTMVFRAGDAQSSQILTQLPNAVEVSVLDADGSPKAGQAVTFGIVSAPKNATGQLVTPASVTTDANGRASALVKLGNKVGAYRIAAASTGLDGSPVEFNLNAVAGAAASLVQISGDKQTRQFATTLDSAFVVRAFDIGENPVPGVTVQFSIDSIPGGATGQRLAILNSVTDAQGNAAAVLTFGDRTGVYRVSASVIGKTPVVFRATAVTSTGAVSMAYLAGDAQSAQILTQIANPMTVRMLNATGNPVPGQTVTFAVDSIPAGATGQTITPTTATTDAQGRATAVLKLGDKIGVYKITASAIGLAGSPVEFRARATAGVARTLLVVAGNGQTKPIGVTLDTAFVVRVVDQGNNPVSGVPVQYSFDSAPNGATGQRLTLLSPVTDALGQASAIMTLGTKVGSYVVNASTTALPGSIVRFTASAGVGPAAAIVLTSGSEQSASIFSELAAPFVVTVVDIGGNPVSGVNVQFALDSIPRVAIGQILRIINSTTDADGQASAYLRLGNKDGRYTVLATSTNLIISTVRFGATATVFGGDVNGNNTVDIADLTTVIDHLLGKIRLTGIDSVKGDFNKDGTINVLDVVAMQNSLLTISPSNSGASTSTPLASLKSVENSIQSVADSTSAVKGEFVLTDNGVRFNLSNSIPLKGLHLIVKFKSGVTIARPDIIFDRALVDSFYFNVRGTEMRIVVYNMQNVPIAAGEGPLFRLPIKITDVSAFEVGVMTVSKTDNTVLFDQALAQGITVRPLRPQELPTTFVLYQNYPNPFNERTKIDYEIADAAGQADVIVQVFNTLGQRVKTLVSGRHAGGRFTVAWDGTDDSGNKLSSGSYYYRLISGSFISSKKMIMLK